MEISGSGPVPCGQVPVVERDIATRQDIAVLVADFYTRVFADGLIGPVFTEVARLDLATHLPIMCDFWETVLLGAGVYRRNTFIAHRRLAQRHPLTPAHFARWLVLWTESVDDRYVGAVAERAKLQASRIAHSMARRLDPDRRRQQPDVSRDTESNWVESQSAS